MPAPASPEQLVAIARAHQRQLLAVRDRTVATISNMWARIVTGPDDTVMARWLAAAVPVVSAAQLSTAGAAIAYIGTYVAAATGTTPVPVKLNPSAFLAPRGVELTEVLARPMVELRTGLANGDRWLTAVDAGRLRAGQFAGTDPMLSARAAASEAMKIEPRVVGFRRVPDAGACKFCLLASTQRYHDTDLMPMHPNCGCSVAPIVGAKDPGRVLDKQLLGRLRDEGVIDDINRRRQAQAAREIGDRADAAKSKAQHWREQSASAADSSAKKRYAERADEWDRKADKMLMDAGLLDRPAANIEAGRKLVDELFGSVDQRRSSVEKLVTVHEHGELGPTLYGAGQKFSRP